MAVYGGLYQFCGANFFDGIISVQISKSGTSQFHHVTFSAGTNSSSFEKYIQYLNEQCNISFHTYTDHESEQLKWQDLTSPEKYCL